MLDINLYKVYYMNMRSYNCCTPNTVEFLSTAQLSELLRVISEENRLKILCLLEKQEHCVCDMLEHFDMSQSLVSHHLADLREVGLVTYTKTGRRVSYSLTHLGQSVVTRVLSLRKEFI
jgi:DNA-binding transcriptional ArsR family regulator